MNPTPVADAGDLKSRLRLHTQFPSKVEDEKHDFVVYLPPMYDEQPDRRFPVLYMQDGQNLFDPETCFINGNYWHMGETADHLTGTGEIELDGDWWHIEPGSVVYIPAGTRHRLIADGEVETVVVAAPPFDPADEFVV